MRCVKGTKYISAFLLIPTALMLPNPERVGQYRMPTVCAFDHLHHLYTLL